MVEQKVIVLLDSTFLVDVLRRKPAGVALLQQVLSAGHQVRTSAINVAEIYAGMRESEAARTAELLSGIPAYDVTPVLAERAGRLKYASARKGITHELDDMIVAATALEYGLLLISDNRKDFKGTGVTFYSAGEN
jgi:predicted nucleic acid-binding protein